MKAWQPFHSHKENGANSPSKTKAQTFALEKDKCKPFFFIMPTLILCFSFVEG
jgi:hypothetical protein